MLGSSPQVTAAPQLLQVHTFVQSCMSSEIIRLPGAFHSQGPNLHSAQLRRTALRHAGVSTAGMLVAPKAGMLVAPSPRPSVSDAKCLKAGMLTVPLPLPAIPDSRGQQLSHPFLRWPAGPARQLILDKVAEDKSRILVWGMVTDQAGGQPYLRCATSLPSTSQVGEVAVRGADQ